MMIEAAAQAAWGTDRGQPIATAVVCRVARGPHHPSGRRRHRAHRDCRPRPSPHACGRCYAGWVSPTRRWPSSIGCSPSIRLLNMTPFAWLKAVPDRAKGGPRRRIARSADAGPWHWPVSRDCRSQSMRTGCGNSSARVTPPTLINSAAMLPTGGAQFSWQPFSTWKRD